MIHEIDDPGGGDLVTDCPFPEASAVLAGNNPGWVFADDLVAPRSALVWAQGMQGFYLVGDADNATFVEELDTYTQQVLEPRLQDLGVTWFEVSRDDNWNPVIAGVFGRRNLESSQQWVYTAKPGEYESMVQLEPASGCILASVEPCLVADSVLTKKAFLLSKLSQFWGRVDAFLGTGTGFALVREGEIASLCLSAFVVGNVHVIDIETKISYQGRGYAQIVAHAFLAACLERRLRFHWDCMAENTASVRLAQKLGLTCSHAYTLYGFPL